MTDQPTPRVPVRNPLRPVLDEPKHRGAVVRDRQGDLWRRGNTRWTCLTPVDGERVLRVGRLPWHALRRMYGPLTSVGATGKGNTDD